MSGLFCLTGGLNDNANASLKTHAYNPATNSWTDKASMPGGQTRGASKVLDGKLYIAGGFNNTGTTVATLRVYNPNTNSWATGTPCQPHAYSGPGRAGSSS
jgi:N-acetylneuraminic acid mutarotase